MYVKVIRSYRDVVAICDEDLIGKRFEDDNFQLDVKEHFFKGEEASKERVKEIISEMSTEDATFNIVGENSVKVAIELGIIAEESIKRINNIPFVLILA